MQVEAVRSNPIQAAKPKKGQGIGSPGTAEGTDELKKGFLHICFKKQLDFSTSPSQVISNSLPIRVSAFILENGTQRTLDLGHHAQLTARVHTENMGTVLETELINDDCHL